MYHTDYTGATSNPGYDPSADELNSSTNTHSQGGNQATNWKKFADETMEEYLSRCPGAYGGPIQPPTNSGHNMGQDDPYNNVCCCYKHCNLHNCNYVNAK